MSPDDLQKMFSADALLTHGAPTKANSSPFYLRQNPFSAQAQVITSTQRLEPCTSNAVHFGTARFGQTPTILSPMSRSGA